MAMMPPMPPGGGGMPPGAGAPPQGAMLAQVLQQLMSSPAAMQGMQNFMQGRAPTAGMPMPPSKGGMVPPGMSPQNPIPMPPPGAAPRGAGVPMPPGGGPPPDSETQGPPPGGGDPAEAAASKQIDEAGNTWDGVDAPTKNDIQRLEADPTPAAIKSFDQQFGPGMAEKYLGESGGEAGGDSQEEEDAEGDQGSASAPEYDK